MSRAFTSTLKSQRFPTGTWIDLCDFDMPKTNGYELARQIRETAWGKSVTLVAVTGKPMEIGDLLKLLVAEKTNGTQQIQNRQSSRLHALAGLIR